jgi:AbiU2
MSGRFERWLGKLSACDRIRLAKERADNLVGHTITLFLMHEANALVVYSPKLAGQIPRSRAAHAFNQFQRSMHLFEIIRLCALWDSPGTDRESIPTIVELFNVPALVDQIARDRYDHYAKHESADLGSDPDFAAAYREAWKKDRAAAAREAEQRLRQRLGFAAEKAAEVSRSSRLKAMRDFRDAHIAHNLALPEPDLTSEEDVLRMRPRDEAALLKDTVAVANALHGGLNDTSFDWEDSRQMASRNAAALWDNCAFHVPSRLRSA